MSKYIVTIEETVAGNFEVEAESAAEARELARRRYRAGEFVLEPGEVQEVAFVVNDEEGEASIVR